MSYNAVTYLVLLLLLSSCNNINQREFDAKPIIGIFGDNQGMVTYEGNLYADSSFYIPESPLMDEAAGCFFIRGNVITFIQSEGQFYFDTLHLTFDTLKPPYQNLDPDGEVNYVVFKK